MGRSHGEKAERFAQREYGFEPSDADTHDGVDGSTWYEVKSCQRRDSDGAKGRFRLWRQQHEALLEKDRSETAWYVFVLYTSSGSYVSHKRVHASTVSVSSWNKGHPDGEQFKLPYQDVFPLE